MHFQDIAYRAHNPQWAWEPTSGAGAARHGGRFNPVGVEALYLSLGPITAIREVSQLGKPLQPLTLCAYEIDSRPVFDSRDATACKRQGIDPADLGQPDWRYRMLNGETPRSQILAEQLQQAGFTGLIVRSYAARASQAEMNLVLFRWDTPESRVRVIDDDHRLPRDRSSWEV